MQTTVCTGIEPTRIIKISMLKTVDIQQCIVWIRKYDYYQIITFI